MDTGWSLSDARAAREAANARLGRVHCFAQVSAPFVSTGMALARKVGPALDRAVLARASRRMNRNMGTAFDGYDLRAGDVVASAYVKAGTNWVMYMCHQLAHLGAAEFDHVQDVIPWPDAAEPRYWLSLHDDAPRHNPTGYRLIKSHLAADDLPASNGAKFIGITRDPKDCAASAYHYFQTILLGPAMPPPDVWLDHFLSDDAIFGRWDLFTATWYARRDRDDTLFLRFEEIKADPGAVIDRIAAFLQLDLSDKIRAKVREASDFKNMRGINERFYPVRQSIWTDPDGKIIRKGAVGDGQGLFSAQALARLDEAMTRGLARLGSDFPYEMTYGVRAGED